jgi:formylglycine-generating enzyme required for sulfatase activity
MPIVEVSWLGARNYCASIGKRLPTEAEWEFAARGPEGWLYPWGNSTQIKPAHTATKAGVIWHLFMRIQKGNARRCFRYGREMSMNGRLVFQSPTLTVQMTDARA